MQCKVIGLGVQPSGFCTSCSSPASGSTTAMLTYLRLMAPSNQVSCLIPSWGSLPPHTIKPRRRLWACAAIIPYHVAVWLSTLLPCLQPHNVSSVWAGACLRSLILYPLSLTPFRAWQRGNAIIAVNGIDWNNNKTWEKYRMLPLWSEQDIWASPKVETENFAQIISFLVFLVQSRI